MTFMLMTSLNFFFIQGLALLTKAKETEKGLNSLDGPSVSGVVTRGML